MPKIIVYQGFRTGLVWMDFWEEITEFIYIAAVLAILWCFRRSLFANETATESGP